MHQNFKKNTLKLLYEPLIKKFISIFSIQEPRKDKSISPHILYRGYEKTGEKAIPSRVKLVFFSRPKTFTKHEYLTQIFKKSS